MLIVSTAQEKVSSKVGPGAGKKGRVKVCACMVSMLGMLCVECVCSVCSSCCCPPLFTQCNRVAVNVPSKPSKPTQQADPVVYITCDPDRN
jgi:hypothetical protein